MKISELKSYLFDLFESKGLDPTVIVDEINDKFESLEGGPTEEEIEQIRNKAIAANNEEWMLKIEAINEEWKNRYKETFTKGKSYEEAIVEDEQEVRDIYEDFI